MNKPISLKMEQNQASNTIKYYGIIYRILKIKTSVIIWHITHCRKYANSISRNI